MHHYPLLIANAQQQPHQTIDVTSPYSGQAIARFDCANQDDIESALTLAHQAFIDRDHWLSISERITILQNAIALIEQQSERLIEQATIEGGKPITDSRIEMARCIDSIRYCIDTLRTQSSATVPMSLNSTSAGHITTVQKQPIGVVVAISAFNHPLNLIAHQIAPAIATGCPVIIKPAETTPISCYKLVDIFHQAGLPQQWCQALLTNDHTLTEQLVSDSRVAFFSFIGSAKVGWYLRSKLAAGTRCALEHGGIAPIIVAEDANLEQAVAGITKAGFYHAGQVCVSAQRIFVDQAIAAQFSEQLVESVRQLTVGDPLSEKTDVGPLIRAQAVTRIVDWVNQAIADGAECLVGGYELDHQSYAPTVLFNPPADSPVSRCELFAPVVCVYPYQELDQAIAQANDSEFAFQAAIYSSSIDTAMFAAQRLSASAVMLNQHTAFRVDWMPFAGLKQSGLGTGGIPYTMDDMQINKMIVIASQGLDS